MGTFEFSAEEVRRLVDHCRRSPKHEPCYGEEPEPGLWLVGDRGVYLMSNGTPRLALVPGGVVSFVAYAAGINPNKDADWYEAKRSKFGGDDGGETIPVAMFEKVLAAGGKVVRVTLTETQIEVSN